MSSANRTRRVGGSEDDVLAECGGEDLVRFTGGRVEEAGNVVDSPFPHGCFVTAASCEPGGRPGELRTFRRDTVIGRRRYLREQIVAARAAGDLDTGLDADSLVSTLSGIAMSANQELQLLGDDTAAPRARRLMRAAIGSSV